MKDKTCRLCGGTGQAFAAMGVCPACGGRGIEYHYEDKNLEKIAEEINEERDINNCTN